MRPEHPKISRFLLVVVSPVSFSYLTRQPPTSKAANSDYAASQPDMRMLADDSGLYAEEYHPSGTPYVRIQYYGNAGLPGLQALIANPAVKPTTAMTMQGTLLAKADGTPEFGRISYDGAIAS